MMNEIRTFNHPTFGTKRTAETSENTLRHTEDVGQASHLGVGGIGKGQDAPNRIGAIHEKGRAQRAYSIDGAKAVPRNPADGKGARLHRSPPKSGRTRRKMMADERMCAYI
jgi:hypothetical protein